ncbi:MAG: homoserine O-succinyltransferase [Woeseia sp.]|nr:homoserine O-succinyltransferase [Woeseia sp.]NNE59646.1 homoserine O-succinyltransferase [Woeseia sp.]
MPLIAHNDLPSYGRLSDEGQVMIGGDRATHQDIRELHVGLLNMMPDAALEATERQFLRLIGASNRIAQFYVHLFTVEGLDRSTEAQRHIASYYERFEDLADAGLDALIVTGANITGPDLTRETFFEPMTRVADWAQDNVTSVLCSCLASHAIWRHRYGIERRPLQNKLWGVFEHRTIERQHPIVSGVNTRFYAPHSRYNDVSGEQLTAAGLTVLTRSDEAGVLLATSDDGLRFIYLQGHPEYDTGSLAKEYKREVARFLSGEREDYPPYPHGYLDDTSQALLDEYRQEVLAGATGSVSGFPEVALLERLDNTWIDTAKSIFNNWLGLVYQTTGADRRTPFMNELDPADPLHLIQYKTSNTQHRKFRRST